jgi:hypothetical protein
MTIQDTFKFIDELVTHAVTEAKGGNMALLNRLGDNPAIAYYIDNVHFRQVWTQEAWAQYRPGDFKEIEALQEAHTAAEKATLNEVRVTSLEGKLEDVSKQLTEALTLLKATQPAAKKGDKRIMDRGVPQNHLVHETTEPETDADATAETETEETTDEPAETEDKADTEGK